MSFFSELKYKEVIDLRSGQRLGYVCDAEIDPADGKILSLIVPGPGRAGGLLGRDDDYVLPWSSLSRLGDDIILVDLQSDPARKRREKRQLFY
ncbi:MAG: YlmC/YmxH family sporulation protein [Oscillospiraceae bacterium]